MTIGQPRSVGELIDELADACGWPRTRPARLLAGSRATRVAGAALCASDDALQAPHEPDTALLLAAPPTSESVRRGRRSYDVGAESQPEAWARIERPLIDGSELLAGGRGGFDELLASALGIDVPDPLVPVDRDELKFVGFVPEDALEQVRTALFRAGAGVIGDYTQCSWSTAGTGTFRGGADADPTVGERGRFEQVAEVRLETVCPSHLRNRVSRAFVQAHPYEEPAYEVHVLRTPGRVGLGRRGEANVTHALTALRSLVPDVELVQPANHGRTTQGVAAVAVTTGALSAVLHEIVVDPDLALVVCSQADAPERALLSDLGIQLAVVDRSAVAARLGEQLAGRLSRQMRLRVQLVAPLRFPGSPQASTDGTSDDARAFAAGEAPAATPADADAVSADSTAPHAGGAPAQLWFDGGSRGNPGPAACGFVIYDDSKVELERAGHYLGRATNNVAEYTGLLRGLERALEMGARELEVYSDSELVVKQLKGQYKVKHEAMKPLYQQAVQLLSQLDRYTIKHVLRARNSVADGIVNATLDAQRASR